MSLATIAVLIIAALFIDLGYGLLVYFASPKRSVNQQFLLLTISIGVWLVAVYSALLATTSEAARILIASAIAASSFMPVSFCLLRLAIKRPEELWTRNVARLKWIIAANIVWGAAAFTRPFIADVQMSRSAVAEPVYGILFPYWNLYFLILIVFTIISFLRGLRTSEGMRKVELQFVLLGAGSSFLIGVTLAFLVPVLTGTSKTAPLAPVGVIILNSVIAYGIVTRRIMGVAAILQRITAHVLLVVYLCGIYAFVLFGFQFLLSEGTALSPELPHLFAALATAGSIIPAHVWFQNLAIRLFGGEGPLNIAAMVQRADAILNSITTLDELLHRFVLLVQESFSVDSVAVYLAAGDGYALHYPAVTGSRNGHLGASDPLVHALRAQREPIVVESVSRRRATPDIAASARYLEGIGVWVGAGIYTKNELTGIILLGARKSGRIYGAVEQEALQILCAQLGVTVENAKLYTQAQNSRLYNDILVDSLVSGVIAIGTDHNITVLNREAQRILKRPASAVLARHFDVLPAPLRDTLQRTFDSGKSTEDQELGIELSPEEIVHVRVGSAIFRGHTGEVLGALLVIHDVMAIKQLQAQIRRSDRLASMGTLSAGMAHEIKNPLVTIRTFTQLLPERYDDPEFRGTFLALVGDEVKRIDGIVNQLLRFSRPSKPKLEAMHVHASLNDALRLVNEEFRRKNITVTLGYTEGSDEIVGDADLLGQAFVNFFLNAQEAMKDGDRLTVSTRTFSALNRSSDWGVGGPALQSIRIEISDTGEGIKDTDVARIFDPFFTTKSKGTGLGLTVAHGIIHDHGGMIDVMSVVGQGTTLVVDLPCSAQEGSHA